MIELDVIDPAKTKRDDGEHDSSRKRFWRSYQDLAKHPDHEAIRQDEFMDGTSKPPTGSTRREFMKVMGASMAMAGLTACRRPVEHILPHARQPEERTEGIPLYYATAMPYRGSVRALLVESHDGRPTKVEGNPDHPFMDGATSVFEQASVLNLYDPDRSRFPLRDGTPAAWPDFVSFAQQIAFDADDIRIAVLCGETSSPTLLGIREQMEEAYGEVHWIDYRSEGNDNERIGLQEAYGQPVRPLYDFSEAEVIVSLDSDFLGPAHPATIQNTRTFAESRRIEDPDEEISRLYAVESTFSPTGGAADNRLRMQAGRIPALAKTIAERLGVGEGLPQIVDFTAREEAFIDEIVSDLAAAGSNGVLLAGETQPPAIHALCAAVNAELGSELVTMLDVEQDEHPPQSDQLRDLVVDMEDGAVDVLLTIGANPVYDLPDDMRFETAMQGIEETIHVGLHLDETAQASRWHLPQAHYLEAWGDGRSYDGTLSIIQPLIAPLYDDAHSGLEVLNVLATGADRSGYDLVRTEWEDEAIGEDFEQGWRRVLHDGFLPDTGYDEVNGDVSVPDLADLSVPGRDDIEVVFRVDPALLGGEFANNAWMQELPEPITKIVWDNVAIMSQRTADDIGVDIRYRAGQWDADVISLTVAGQSVELPIWIQPGYPDASIGITIGYGREVEPTRERPSPRIWDFATAYTGIYDRDPVANGVGQRVAPIRPLNLDSVMRGIEIEATGESHLVVSTQEHGSMVDRPLVRHETLEGYRESPDFVHQQGEPLVTDEPYEVYPELWADDHPSDAPGIRDSNYTENQWGMVIDLNTCTGCNACMVACQSENNIQVVGKEEVARGREMHWLRLDRYYVSDEDNPDEAEMMMQPMLCQHCDNAPCEPVCPVAATVQSPDGLNEMVYNRCIGTRYCSNNCPYKVRKFNFFNWADDIPVQVQMAQNPDVTVRFRGVMEKCTWCIQRIRGAQQRANIESRALETDEVQTACQQVCPANAIVFGDMNDPGSRVVAERENLRRYQLLEYLGTKPRLSYLGLVKNPNPRLAPDAFEDPPARVAS